MSFLDGDSTEAVEMHYFTVYRIAMECVNFAADFTWKITENAFSNGGI